MKGFDALHLGELKQVKAQWLRLYQLLTSNAEIVEDISDGALPNHPELLDTTVNLWKLAGHYGTTMDLLTMHHQDVEPKNDGTEYFVHHMIEEVELALEAGDHPPFTDSHIIKRMKGKEFLCVPPGMSTEEAEAKGPKAFNVQLECPGYYVPWTPVTTEETEYQYRQKMLLLWFYYRLCNAIQRKERQNGG